MTPDGGPLVLLVLVVALWALVALWAGAEWVLSQVAGHDEGCPPGHGCRGRR